MQRTEEFRTALTTYEAVMQSETLTVSEKTAIIEILMLEYGCRNQPEPYLAVMRRLATLTPRISNGIARPEAVGSKAPEPSKQPNRRR